MSICRVVNIGGGKNIKFLSTWREKMVRGSRFKVEGLKHMACPSMYLPSGVVAESSRSA
jgi:hypothetical protein